MASELKLSGPLVVGSASSDPGTGYDGELYYNTTSNMLRQYVNGAWANVSSGAGAGTVTSVSFEDGSTTPIYTVTGSPVTSSGTLEITLNTQTANEVFAGPTTGSAAQPSFRSLVAADIPSLSATYVTQSEVGAASGVASLDGSGKVPVGQLPSVVMEYQGAWNPNTNTPTLVDGTGTNGNVYYVSALRTGTVSGLTDPSMTNFQIGDLVIYSGALSVWQLVTPAAGVQSVNGAQGAVTVNAINQLSGDVTTSAASGSQSEASTISAGAVTASKLGTVTDGVTLDQSGSGSTLEIKSGGVGTTQLASSSVTAAKLGTITDGTTLDQSGSGSTLEVKAGGISNTQVNASAAIALSKLAALNNNIVPVTNGSGVISNSSSTNAALISTGFQRGQSGSALVLEDYVDSTTLTDNTSSPTSVSAFTFAQATYAGFEMTYYINDGQTPADIRIGTIRVVSNGTNTSIIDTYTETASVGVSWTSTISGSNTLLNYTTTNLGTDRTLRADVKYFRA